MNFIYGLLAGIVVSVIACVLWPKKKEAAKTEEFYVNEAQRVKKENIAKIESYIADKDRFANDELQNMLGVANTTIKRYLQDLEDAGKIKQIGAEGKYVYYIKA